jgi:hypothetical protein
LGGYCRDNHRQDNDGGLCGSLGGSILLFLLLMIALGMWRISVSFVSFNNIVSAEVESFYWVTILFSNILGTASGDFFADDSGLGYEGSAVILKTMDLESPGDRWPVRARAAKSLADLGIATGWRNLDQRFLRNQSFL